MLDELPSRGLNQYLSLSENHNPQPVLDSAAEFLLGPAGLEGGMNRGRDGRGIVEEPVYAFWVDQGWGVVVSDSLLCMFSS